MDWDGYIYIYIRVCVCVCVCLFSVSQDGGCTETLLHQNLCRCAYMSKINETDY